MSAPVARQRRIARWSGGVLGLLGIVLAGCENDSGTVVMSGTGGTAPVQHHMLENIPLPAGFRLVAQSSHAVQTGGARFASMEFEGESYPDRVVNFYTEYMPAAKFRLRQKTLDRGESVLRFESDDEECVVRVRPQKSKKTVVGIYLRPLPRASAEPKAPPGGSPRP